jgi:hypothetical protein
MERGAAAGILFGNISTSPFRVEGGMESEKGCREYNTCRKGCP